MNTWQATCSASAGKILAGALLLFISVFSAGCFTAAQGISGATGSGSSASDDKAALVADVVTLPVQAPLIAGLLVLSTPDLIGQALQPNDIAGVKKIRLRVVDDEGSPLPGVHARIGYGHRRRTGSQLPEGPSNAKGLFPKTYKIADLRHRDFETYHSGFYAIRSSDATELVPRNASQPKIVTSTIVLKRVRNPVPMYARRVMGGVPVWDGDAGYDLVLGDWLAPHGRGKVADMIFHVSGERTDERNYDLELVVTFPGSGNGMIAHEVPLPLPSVLRMPYEAPAHGYAPRRVWRALRKYNPATMNYEASIDDFSKTRNYFIRVRSEVDPEGNVTRALFGKIHAPFEFRVGGQQGIWGVDFTYYLNPDGTRNIEFDPYRNLLKPAKRDDDHGYRGLAP